MGGTGNSLPVSEGQEAIQKNVSADIPFLYLKPADFWFDFLLFWKWNHHYLFNYKWLYRENI